jgi:16S rRNA (guanine1207-N2)-methyltransferase
MGNNRPDPILTALLQHSNPQHPTLWFADEHLQAIDPAWLDHPAIQVIINRYDVWQRFVQQDINAQFNDFVTEHLPPASVQRVYHRIAKEKPVVHHVINQAAHLLAPGGELWLAGAKREGIRTYCAKAAALFGTSAEVRKQGNVYLGRIVRSIQPAGPALDDRDYPRLRPIATTHGMTLLSKPGLFAWDKIDRGSALLVEQLPEWRHRLRPKNLVDLGCGYGYLALMAHYHGVEPIVATDNNAAALLACQANFAAQGVNGTVVAGNCGDGLDQRFDALLCNPPFHRGFTHHGDLTEQFLVAIARLLSARGRALVVVNRFIPVLRLAEKHFRQRRLYAENSSFQVFELGL